MAVGPSRRVSLLASLFLATAPAAGAFAMPAALPPAVLPTPKLPVLAPATRPATASPFEREVLALEAAERNRAVMPGGVLFYGSSSIRLWKSVAEDFPGLNVLNHGFGGSTCPDAISYLDRLVLPYKPSTVVLYSGDNDLSKGRTPEQLLADYQAFAKLIHAKLPATKIVYVSVKPSPKRADLLVAQRRVNGMLADWVKQAKDDRLSYVDVFQQMLDTAGRPRTDLFGPDRLHMNREGYKLWVKGLRLVATATEGKVAEAAEGAKAITASLVVPAKTPDRADLK